MSKNKITVKVCGTELNILSEDSAEYTQKIAAEVDKKMRLILQASPHVSISSIAVLAALDFCDMSSKLGEEIKAAQTQIQEYLEDSQNAREEADEARRENEKLKSEIETLRQRLAENDAKQGRQPQEPLSAPVRKSSRRNRRVITSTGREEAADEILSFFSDNNDSGEKSDNGENNAEN